MRVLLAIKGPEGPAFFSRLVSLLALGDADEILLAHVIDSIPRSDLDLGRERFLGRSRLGSSRQPDLDRADRERAETALQFARGALYRLGVPHERLEDVLLQGKPNDELRRVAEERGVDLIVVGGRTGRLGPHSIGKTARFLIDHASIAAMLVRTG